MEPCTLEVLGQSGSDCTRILQMLLKDEVFFPAIIAGSIIIIVALRTVGGMVKNVSRERTRREIAAFIAEGSMTPEEGERLMKAGHSRSY